MSEERIPIVVGITGHRNICRDDFPIIKERVKESLSALKDLCGDTPVVMLCGFAEGADMLCADVAEDMGMDVYAVLPREESEYIKSFKNPEDKARLHSRLSLAKRVFVAPDAERSRERLEELAGMKRSDYEYRQLGIYIAERSHVLLALWDGEPPKEYGCGTAEVVKFALEHNYLNEDRLFAPGAVNDTPVIHIKVRRENTPPVDISARWLTSNIVKKNSSDDKGEFIRSDAPPERFLEVIKKTAAYNAEQFTLPEGEIKLWRSEDDLDGYRKSLRYHYSKADDCSYNRNQSHYNRLLLLLAVAAAMVAMTFLIYDDASLIFMIFPCTLFIGAVCVIFLLEKRKSFHRNYIDYRALAEALRIQFYSSMCIDEDQPIATVSELYSWAQKVDFVWIDKALRAISVVSDAHKLNVDKSEVIDVWLGMSEKPKGQLKYHSSKLGTNEARAKKYGRLSSVALTGTLLMYSLLFVAEIVGYALRAAGIDWFWEGELAAGVSWRSAAAMVLGTLAAASLLFSEYWGKLSYDRKADDNYKMGKFYAAAIERWKQVKNLSGEVIEKFVREIAREEILENGVWYTYVSENELEIDI